MTETMRSGAWRAVAPADLRLVSRRSPPPPATVDAPTRHSAAQIEEGLLELVRQTLALEHVVLIELATERTAADRDGTIALVRGFATGNHADIARARASAVLHMVQHGHLAGSRTQWLVPAQETSLTPRFIVPLELPGARALFILGFGATHAVTITPTNLATHLMPVLAAIQASDVLNALLPTIVRLTGELPTAGAPDSAIDPLLGALVQSLAAEAKVDLVMLAEALDDDDGAPTRARTLAIWKRGEAMDTFEFKLEGSPCADVVEAGWCWFERDVQEAYVRDGFLARHGITSYAGTVIPPSTLRPRAWLTIMHSEPLTDRPLLESMLRIFAVRAAAELERIHARTRNAFFDSLTGLPNRALLLDRMEGARQRAQRNPDSLYALVVLDLDRFKLINDSRGHAAGDHLLVEAARRLRACVRQVDTVARLGGDEFAILLDELEEPAAVTQVVERIREVLGESVHIAPDELFVSASFGIVFVSDDATPAEIVRDAQTAMHRAKQRGRSRYEIFDAHMHAHVVELLHLEADVRRALARGEFEMHYQPIIDALGRIVSLEALLRWNHPTRGLLTPGAFLDLAEETGAVLELGRFALTEACRQAHAWQQRSLAGELPVSVAVNVGAREFANPGFQGLVVSALRETGLDPSALVLEITEGVLLRDGEVGLTRLLGLRTLGVRIHLDDFGTGYSSLSHLWQLPVDVLKIDRSFIARLAAGNPHREIVRAIVTLAQTLHIGIVAEGIETPEQHAEAMALGCEWLQGYYIARPMPACDAEMLLAAGPVNAS